MMNHSAAGVNQTSPIAPPCRATQAASEPEARGAMVVVAVGAVNCPTCTRVGVGGDDTAIAVDPPFRRHRRAAPAQFEPRGRGLARRAAASDRTLLDDEDKRHTGEPAEDPELDRRPCSQQCGRHHPDDKPDDCGRNRLGQAKQDLSHELAHG
jgi:hypothetical protein